MVTYNPLHLGLSTVSDVHVKKETTFNYEKLHNTHFKGIMKYTLEHQWAIVHWLPMASLLPSSPPIEARSIRDGKFHPMPSGGGKLLPIID